MSRAGFAAALVALLLALNAYPLYQLASTGGYLFYTNGFDEASYLQYDFSAATQRLSRSGQYLVTLGHRLGLSGGWINLVLDVATTAALVLVTRAILARVGLGERQARMGALLVAGGPLLVGGLNPFVRRLFALNLESGLIYWLTVPEAASLPVLRSPEPQVSLVLAALGIYGSLRYRSFLPAYACMPLLYSFVLVPFAFVVLAVHLRTRVGRVAGGPIAAAAISFLAVSAALAAVAQVHGSEGAGRLLVASRSTLISFTAALGIALYLLARRRIPEHLRYVALVVALSPLAAANQQLVSGWLAQPNNFEQFFGVSALALLLALWAVHEDRGAAALALLLGLAVVLSASETFRENQEINRRLPLNGQVLEALKRESGSVMIDDVALASRASLLFPRQPPTMLAYQHTYVGQADRSFARYLCAREATRRDPALEPRFREVFAQLDRAYRYENRDFVLLGIGRQGALIADHDPERGPEDCESVALQYVLVARR